MRVRMLQNVAGPNGIWREDEEHDLPAAQAKAWIKNGQAEPLMRNKSAERETRGS